MHLKEWWSFVILSILIAGCISVKVSLNIKDSRHADVEMIYDLSKLVPLFNALERGKLQSIDTTVEFEHLSYEQKLEILKSLGKLLATITPGSRNTEDVGSRFKRNFVKYVSKFSLKLDTSLFIYRILLKDVPLKELDGILHDSTLLNIRTLFGGNTVEIYLMGVGSKDTLISFSEGMMEPTLEFEVRTNLKILKHNAHRVKEDGRLFWKFRISDVLKAERNEKLLKLILSKN